VNYYHFELQISDQEDFSNIIVNVNSRNDQTNWNYEKEENEFSPVEAIGVRSNYAGRRIQYISLSKDYLTRGETYYFRIRQTVSATTYGEYSYYQQVIYT
jgi:hypothetical protein